MPDGLPRLTAAQAAARLGVKPATLYAYVSRGLLGRQRTATGSTFDPFEVESFANGRRRPPAAAAAGSSRGSPLMVLDTDIAAVEEDELLFRGRPVAELVELPAEAVSAWLWGGELDATARPRFDGEAVAAARALLAALPPHAALIDRLQTAVTGLAAADPLRYEPSAGNLRRVGGALLTGLPRAISRGTVDADESAAAALWPALGGGEPDAAGIRALNAALVLLADHDLAVSTLAARVAASARASGYAIVTAALGAFDSPLHGNASRAAAELLERVIDGATPEAALAAAVRDGGRGLPGFGQPLYAGTDARVRALLPLLTELDGAEPVVAAVDAVSAAVRRRAGLHPNVDLALGALTLAAGFRHDAGVAVFALGRLAGWIAHALDEYERPPLRLRPRGRYVGP